MPTEYEYDPNLAKIAAEMQAAPRPERVFGPVWVSGRKPLEVLEESYRRLASQIDPALFRSSPLDADLARDLVDKLDRLYAVALARFEAAAYGTELTPLPARSRSWQAFRGTKLDLILGDAVANGQHSTVYEGARAAGDELVGRVAIKVVDDAKDNDRVWREKTALEMMHRADGRQRSYLPALLDHFAIEEDGRLGLVTRFCESSVSLAAARDSPLHVDGIDRKHVAWMLNRILAVAGYAHSLGIVHGKIEPSRLFLRPQDHNVTLIGWSWSAIEPAKTGHRFEPRTGVYDAPELAHGGDPLPRVDLYSIGKCAIFALGGNVETNEMPDSVEPDFQRFVLSLVDARPERRRQDAWATWHEFMGLVRTLWEKKFLEFRV